MMKDIYYVYDNRYRLLMEGSLKYAAHFIGITQEYAKEIIDKKILIGEIGRQRMIKTQKIAIRIVKPSEINK